MPHSAADSTSFPRGFTWGAATAAYQIEGASQEGGRGPSIWDTFCQQPGAVERGESGEVAADHYHRWQQDVGLMADLGIGAYRFSIAWSRILPDGRGKVNAAGFDFYSRLVDALLERGIEPYITLYHWDLPQALQERGGWAARDTAHHFADYAHQVGSRLGDRVSRWITHNEPYVVAFPGHLTGDLAPGLRDSAVALRVVHHLLLSHGLAVEALRDVVARPKVGITLNLSPIYPASDLEVDHQAALWRDGIFNRLFLDPVLRGRYPEDVAAKYGALLRAVQAGDMERIATPLDFLGVNYYTRSVVRHDPAVPILESTQIRPEGNEYSDMWEIYPPGLHELLVRLKSDYAPVDLYITENGIPVPDTLDADGRVRDPRRIRYLRDHVLQVERAIADGVPVRGYFVWSLLDNFEWAFGYRMRFGLVYVDWGTQDRTVKDSGRWYARLVGDPPSTLHPGVGGTDLT